MKKNIISNIILFITLFLIFLFIFIVIQKKENIDKENPLPLKQEEIKDEEKEDKEKKEEISSVSDLKASFERYAKENELTVKDETDSLKDLFPRADYFKTAEDTDKGVSVTLFIPKSRENIDVIKEALISKGTVKDENRQIYELEEISEGDVTLYTCYFINDDSILFSSSPEEGKAEEIVEEIRKGE